MAPRNFSDVAAIFPGYGDATYGAAAGNNGRRVFRVGRRGGATTAVLEEPTSPAGRARAGVIAIKSDRRQANNPQKNQEIVWQ